MEGTHYLNLSLENIDGEIWKDAVGYERLYLVSNFGRIKSLNGFNRGEILILKQSLSIKGYLQIALQKNSDRLNTGVHRLVAQAFIPNPNSLPQVNHKDGVKTNNNDWNLEWNTGKQNVNHAFSTGIKNARGEKNNFHILTTEQVLEIRKNYVAGKRGQKKQMANKYGVAIGTVKNIYLGRAWKHLLI